MSNTLKPLEKKLLRHALQGVQPAVHLTDLRHYIGPCMPDPGGDAVRLPTWDRILTALVLIRMGQELGTNSQLARAVHAVLSIAINIFK